MKNQLKLQDKRSTAVLFTALSMIYTLMVKFINVDAIGPQESSVGFAFINGPVAKALGVSLSWYEVSEVLGYLALGLAALMGVIGLWQWISRKSFLKVDPEILALGILYGCTIALYVLFDKVTVNYRPVLENGILEPSYPSSHTMLSLVVFGSAILLIRRYFYQGGVRRTLWIFALALLLLTVVSRFLSGFHWLTDIIGGILVAVMLLAWYVFLVQVFKNRGDKRK